MKVFSEFDVYERKYTYDEMKVMSLIDGYCGDSFLDYEDFCRIAEAVYAHWSNDDERCAEKVCRYPWIEICDDEEMGYIQAYASRVLPEFIQLYKEEKLY